MKRIMEKIFGTHWKAFLIVGVIIVTGIVLINLRPWHRSVTTEWTSYRNPVYGYSIEYPVNWVLNDGNPSNVEIYNEEHSGEEPILINIFVNDWPIPFAQKVDYFVDDFVHQSAHENVEILSSEPADKWDWVISYRFYSDTWPTQARAYFLQTENYTFTIHMLAIGQTGEGWNLCQQAVNTFEAD